MPNKKSQAKSVRQTAKRTERNRADRSTFRTTLRKTTEALAPGASTDGLEGVLQNAFKVIGKTAKKGLIHKNKAARHMSKLALKLNAAKAAAK